MGIELFELAGLTANKKVPAGSLVVDPGVSLIADGTELTWPRRSNVAPKYVVPAGQMLQQFIGLWNQTGKAVLAFAKRWGRLNVNSEGRFSQSCSRRMEGDLYTEPVEAWTYFSRNAHGVLTIAAKLRIGEPPSEDDWDATSRLERFGGWQASTFVSWRMPP
jgi:hypothetical protein